MKTNILFLLHLPPPVHGSSMVGQFIKESKLINSKFKCNYINLLASKSIADTGRINLNKVWGVVGVWWVLLKTLFSQRPQICYVAITATGAAFFRDVLLVSLLKIFRVQRVYHMHNKGVSKHDNGKLYNLLYNFLFKNAKVILLSEHLYFDIKKYVKKSDIHICPNGIPDVKQTTNLNKYNAKVKLLFLSNLIESKGVFILLEACYLLKKRGVEFECNFIGGEADITKKIFKEKVDLLQLNSCVKYLGKKYGVDKEKYFIEADIFAFPTYYENECFPLVLLEALQYGLPIVSTNEGGIVDIVTDYKSGFIVSQMDAISLAQKLEELIKDEKLRISMGEAGRNKYKENFTLNVFEENLVNILNKISIN